jgi:ClpX C4-type zinc finger protein
MWADLAKQKDFKSIMELALASRLLFRALPNAEGPEEAALLALQLSIEMVVFDGKPPKTTSMGAPVCSFCGRKPPEVRLGAGPEAFICDGCVSDFAAVFREQEK